MMELFGRLNPTQIQKMLRGIIDRMFGGDICGLERKPFFYYIYYRTQVIALQLFVERTAEIYPERMREDGLPEIHDELLESMKFPLRGDP